MCYDSSARPPFPTERICAANGEDLVLTAADGNQFNAYVARAETPIGAWALILPDVRGLHQFYKDLALLFGEAGYHALAIDYFGRSAGLTARDDAFAYMPHVEAMRAEGIKADITAAISAIRGEAHQAPIVTVGFCMGGSLSLLAGANGHDLAGVVGFYAGLSRARGGNPTVLERASAIHVPVLGLFGGADQGIPAGEVEQLDQSLDRAGVAHKLVIYPGAPHSFFDRKWTEFADASADAWTRILGFLAAKS
ncbi:MAG TPA: dienelactone hydrolase family protein [Chloroflexota bacterium]|nr:dienelactone hydrolase family protein [Chloroflexota bacterium]